jgi:hypothetical protein
MDRLLLANLAASLYMTGVIWFVQLVHYPLFAQVGREQFAAYEERHARWTTFAVAPAMLAELGLSLAILLRGRSSAAIWIASGLTALLWLSTFLIQVPLHDRLRSGYNAQSIERLVASNWVRTMGWTLRSALLIWAMTKAK